MAPLDIARVEGPALVLRLVQPEDAEYIYGLRTNPSFSIYLSSVSGTVNDQMNWILSYKERESEGVECYYICERLDGLSCGVVRIYNLNPDYFYWGSWILDQNRPRMAAVESALLSFKVGFLAWGRKQAYIEAKISNERAVSFYRRFGMSEISRTDTDILFVYTRERFLQDQTHFTSLLASTTESLELPQ